jgi:hypothetical protein
MSEFFTDRRCSDWRRTQSQFPAGSLRPCREDGLPRKRNGWEITRGKSKTMVRRVTWFDSPEAADQVDTRYYLGLSPQQKLDHLINLLNEVGRWNEQRLVRTAEFVEIPSG